ncbi:MAG: gamma-glutamyltransferase family protein [Candidatus Izemoplasmatales bacterium]
MNLNHYPFSSKRNVVHANNGVVATSHPLAASAGLRILLAGGNAVDAAIATAACLTVVEPTSNGIGGDAFAICYMNQELYGLNSSGYSPYLLTKEALEERGITEIPRFGFIPVMVPGVPSAWASLNKRFGKLSLLECLTPAIEYAKYGFPVTHEVSRHWQNAAKGYKKVLKGEEYVSFFDTFTNSDIAPSEGEIFYLPDHAKTLFEIGTTNAHSFYHGELADKIDAYSRKYNGFLRKKDLEDYQPSWVKPLSVNYKGYDVCEIPPNGQGIVALEALKIMSHYDLKDKTRDEILHVQIEAIKQSFKDASTYVSDSSNQQFDYEQLLSESYTRSCFNQITDKASTYSDLKPFGSGTVYLATADKDGNMVSYIQSNYMGFGSGLVVPHTGIALQNRGHNFSLESGHPNELGPHKRSYHTIIPGFLMKDGKAIGPFGVMGGFMQPQGHLQVVMNMIDWGMNPQSALDAPRFQWMENETVTVEPSLDPVFIDKLRNRGHLIKVEPELASFGRGEIIIKTENGHYIAGTEPRCDGSIASY